MRLGRFSLLLLAAFAAMLGIDAYWYRMENFTRHFGEATFEGQILSKVRRGREIARDADVIFFGGSFVRYGLPDGPFLKAGLLPYNFALSGGGQLSSYYSLERIAEIIAKRESKPVLVLEIIQATLRKDRTGSHWSEYPLFHALVRERVAMVRDFGLLYRNFRDYGIGDRFLSGFVLPSLLYRRYSRHLTLNGSVDGYFWGMESALGFAQPPDGVSQPVTGDLPPLTLDKVYPSKLEYVERFIRLARSIGARVVLLGSPHIVNLHKRSDPYEPVYRYLLDRYPEVEVIRQSDIGFEIEDFSTDGAAHLNYRGALKWSRYIRDRIPRGGTKREFGDRYADVFAVSALPKMGDWRLYSRTATVTRVGDSDISLTMEKPELSRHAAYPVLLAPTGLRRGDEYFLQFSLDPGQGGASICLVSQPGAASRDGQFRCTYSYKAPLEEKRYLLRITPTFEHTYVVVYLRDAAAKLDFSFGPVVQYRKLAADGPPRAAAVDQAALNAYGEFGEAIRVADIVERTSAFPVVVRLPDARVRPGETLQMALPDVAGAVREVRFRDGKVILKQQHEAAEKIRLAFEQAGKYGIELWPARSGTERQRVFVVIVSVAP